MYGPLGAGHVNPTLGIVAELIRRRHEVTYWAPQMFSERIQETGARFEPVTSTWEQLEGGPPQMHGKEFIRAMGLLLDETAAMVPRLSPAPPPDLVLHDGRRRPPGGRGDRAGGARAGAQPGSWVGAVT